MLGDAGNLDAGLGTEGEKEITAVGAGSPPDMFAICIIPFHLASGILF